MNPSSTLAYLGVFVDTVRAGSFSAVARRHGVAVSSIARQIDALEEEMKVVLFTRSTRALRPTDAGDLLFHRAVRILESVADAHSEVGAIDATVQGVLRITCLPTFGRRYVTPCLARLFEAHPHLAVELDLTERLADPAVERLDAAIRFGALPDSTLVAAPLATQRAIVCASPAYVARYGSLDAVAQLRAHRFVDKRRGHSRLGWREVLGDDLLERAHAVFESDDFEAQRIAVLAGAGIARLPDWVVGHDVQAGRLVEMRPEGIAVDPGSGIHVVRAVQRPSARLAAFTAALVQEIGAPPGWSVASAGG